jgi:hypothetical protein
MVNPQDAGDNPLGLAQTQPGAKTGPYQKHKLPTKELIQGRILRREAKQLGEVVSGGNEAEQRRDKSDERSQADGLREHGSEGVWSHKVRSGLTFSSVSVMPPQESAGCLMDAVRRRDGYTDVELVQGAHGRSFSFGFVGGWNGAALSASRHLL